MEKQEGERKTTLTFPLISKRLQLHHIQLIARGLSLPTAASAGDISVMISGRLHENNRDPSNTQVVITQSEKGEELSLQDMDGVFLRIPASECASSRTSSVSSSELSVELQNTSVLQENNGFSAEERCVEHVLSSMEQELVKARTQLLEAQEEVTSLSIKVSEYSGELLEVQRQLGLEREKVLELVQEKETLQQQLSTSELQSLKEEVKRGQDKVVQLWHTNCQQLLTHDSEMLEKDREIRVLCDRLHKAEMELATLKLERLSAGTHPRVSHSTTTNLMGPTAEGAIPTGTFTATAAPWGRDHSQYRRGKAPPIDEFTGEDRRITFDDWLPILERAATWNGWTQDELLMQLTGYLRGRALQEWKLLDSKDKTTYHSTVKTLRERLDPGNQSLAALDFRHASQRSSETVSDFLRRLEHNYQIAFG